MYDLSQLGLEKKCIWSKERKSDLSCGGTCKKKSGVIKGKSDRLGVSIIPLNGNLNYFEEDIRIAIMSLHLLDISVLLILIFPFEP